MAKTHPDPRTLEREEIKAWLTKHNIPFYKSTNTEPLIRLYERSVEEMGDKIASKTPKKQSTKRKGTPVRTQAKKPQSTPSKETVPHWITQLTPKDLVAKLREHGASAPYTASTRGLLERKLAALVAKGDASEDDEQDEDENNDDDDDEEPEEVPAPQPTKVTSVRKRAPRTPKAKPARETFEEPLGDAHLMSDDESAVVSSAPAVSESAPPTEHDGTLLCNLFLLAVIVILLIAFLQQEE